ncbi:hypothetical protein [Dongia sp.]|uniref:hypothetical protein n=1 Tax=Dongia sp. TaxID=1977262 RepID=UPI0035AF690E
MTISTTISRITYAGDGSTVHFAVPFAFFGADEVGVIERDLASGAEATRLMITHYTVSGGAGQAGTIIATHPPAPTKSWTIFRRTHRTQMVDYTPNDPFPAETHERALDRLTALVQELDDKLDRSATLSPTSTIMSLTLPPPEAGRFLGWRSDLSGLENKNLQGGATVFASLASTLAGIADDESVTPQGLAGLWRKGDDIASAATLSAPTAALAGGYHTVTGSADIEALWDGIPDGTLIELCFEAEPVLRHHPTDFILPGGVDVPALPGDVARFRAEGEGKWRCVSAPPHWYGDSSAHFSMPVASQAASYAMIEDDLGSEIQLTNAGVVLSLLPAAIAGNGGTLCVRHATTSGDVTIQADGSETLDGLASRKLRPGDCVLIRSDGAAWRTIAGDYSYESGEQTLTAAGLLTLAHGLGRRPYLAEVWLRCVVADNGYAVGQEVLVAPQNYLALSIHASHSLRVDSTNIMVRIGNRATASFAYTNGTTGSEGSMTNTSWRLIARARAK